MVLLDWYDPVREDGLLEFWASCLAPAGMPENDPASENGSDSSPNQPTLYGIPVEVMQHIASYLEDPKDFYALIRTNRWIYAAVHPVLYDIDTDFDCDTANGTPLHYAAKGGHVHVAQWLIDHDADVNALSHGICNCGYEYEPDVEDYHEDTPQWIPLHTALCYGQLNVAMLLIDHAVAPDAGRQSLEIHNTIDRLLSLGAAINAVDNGGMTPLATAILAGNYSTALKFLSLGANPDHRPNQPGAPGCRPLYLSVQYRDKSRKKIYLWPNKKHRGRFHEFSDPRHNRRRDKRNIKLLIEALVSAGAKIDALFDSPNRDRRWPRPNDLMTALGWACKKKNFAAVAALILKATNKDSISHSNLENLIKKGSGTVYRGQLECVVEFIEVTYGFQRQSIQRHLKYIVEENHVVLFELLRNKGYLKPIPDGEDVRHPQVLVDTSTVWYATEDLLARSMLSGSECLSETLVTSADVIISTQARFHKGKTLLHIAAQYGMDKVALELLERGAKVDEFDHDLFTPLGLQTAR
ncbi:ankyrin repeat-containing domain protein [Rhypophila decipiens]|uniref:Ankyrin repeat-containing domain protein n=1 Tax=Rhypophila decipiens TaxID=261697 RepID=A0AAN6Y9U9_9PEZI|nr:ankyrin repeat-containing domain protein [Rhypophila decipiens]